LHNLPVDIQKDNLGIDAEGRVVLFDLSPHDDEPFSLTLPRSLETFSPQYRTLLDPRNRSS
jgi:hypothetical protein